MEKLPPELRRMVAEECIEPWTLVIKDFRTDRTALKPVPVLSELPKAVCNVKRINRDFRDDIQTVQIAKFTGNVVTDQSIVNLYRLFGTGGRLEWLVPHIRKLIIRNNQSFSAIRLDANAMIKLEKIMLDVKVTDLLSKHIVSGRRPYQMVLGVTPTRASISAASVARVRAFRDGSAPFLDDLLHRGVPITLRTRGIAKDWRRLIVTDFGFRRGCLGFKRQFVDRAPCPFLVGVHA